MKQAMREDLNMSVKTCTTVIGFDYGHKRIGVAVGQTLTKTAQPLTTLPVKNQQPNWPAIDALIAIWQPTALVVGRPPQHADGSVNAVTTAACYFGEQLQQRYQRPLHLIDETLSSVFATERITKKPPKNRQSPAAMQRKMRIDALAAQIILETWFAECL
jgi:putative Holliday junction resolvase